jgi:small-conductance mechanosensitive channel
MFLRMKKLAYVLALGAIVWSQVGMGTTSIAAGPVRSTAQENAGRLESDDAPATVSERTKEWAAVTVYNRTIVVFRSSLYGTSPKDRASLVTARIGQQIERGVLGPVTKREDKMGALILNNGEIAFTITYDDLDLLSGQTMSQESEDAAQTLSLVLQEARESHSMPIMLKAIGHMSLATAIFAAFVWAIWRLYGWLLNRLKIVLLPRFKQFAIGGSVYLTNIVTAALRFFIKLAAWVAVLFAANLWLTYCLNLFPYTRPWGETLRGHEFTGLAAFGRNIIRTLPDLVVILFIFLITRLFSGLVKRFFAAVETGHIKVSETFIETARPTGRIIVAVLWLAALVAAYPYIPGSNTGAFKGVSLFVGLLVSLGSTSVVGQAASGLILMYSRALKPGEYVRVGDTEGTVLSLGMLATKIQTIKNEEISIPNGVMIGTTTKNYSRLARQEGVILYTSVTIGYDAPWRQVHAMLVQAAGRTEGLRKEPAPFVFQTALSDFYVEYQLNAYIKKPEDRIPVLAALHANIQDVFNESGVQIMSPHYLGDPAKSKIVPKERWYQPPAKSDEKDGPAEERRPPETSGSMG